MKFQRLGACYTENTNTMQYALLLVVLAIRPIAQTEVEILSISVLRETHDEVDLELEYRLSGTRENTRAGAMTMFRGRSTGHWAYRSAKLEPGTHRAVITIGRNADAPEIYFSDSFDVTIGGGVHHKQPFAFEKVWCVDPGACGPEARAELKRAAGAPLAERLTTVQPSIRIMAEEEAKALDEDAKRALLPDLVNHLHDGDVAVRLATLRAIEALDVRDPVLTTPLVEAMADPHPGVSRVATSVLAKLADPTDGLAESALESAAQSSDASTKRYAEDGLRAIRGARLRAAHAGGGPPPANEDDCTAAGGSWGRFGLYVISECNMPTPDAGNSCSGAADCASACLFEIPDAIGTCYGYTILRGTCLTYVENGKPSKRLCVD